MNTTQSSPSESAKSGGQEFLSAYGLHKIEYDFFDRFRFVITAGLGLIAALAWDDIVRFLFDEYFPKANVLLMKFTYALTLTVIAAAVSLTLKGISRKRKSR